ncbi:ABC transporter permease, partial [Mycolicibacterium vaccae]|nr:ABC transporter permease [Mycolicibacterium vaccae]
RYLIDGIKVRQFHLALVGALMVAALALILDAALAFAVWLSAPGTGRFRIRSTTARAVRHRMRSPTV